MPAYSKLSLPVVSLLSAVSTAETFMINPNCADVNAPPLHVKTMGAHGALGTVDCHATPTLAGACRLECQAGLIAVVAATIGIFNRKSRSSNPCAVRALSVTPDQPVQHPERTKLVKQKRHVLSRTTKSLKKIDAAIEAKSTAERKFELENAWTPPPPKLKIQVPLEELPLLQGPLGQPRYRHDKDACNEAGDFGFDPLNLCVSTTMFMHYREAELKHARWAMLAVVGWPVSELLHEPIAKAFGAQVLLASHGRAPAFMNGGFPGDVQALWTGLMFVAFVPLEYVLKNKRGQPGNKGFDPLELRETEPPILPSILRFPPHRIWMDEAELMNGRLAMLAITFFVFNEWKFHTPIIQQSLFQGLI